MIENMKGIQDNLQHLMKQRTWARMTLTGERSW